jgi:hypothetical protein
MQRPSSSKNANPKSIGSPLSVANRGLIPPNRDFCLAFPQIYRVPASGSEMLKPYSKRMANRRWRRGVTLSLALSVLAVLFPTPAFAAQTVTITYATGQTVTWTGSDFGITEGTTNHPTGGSHGDAYDGALLLAVCSDATCTPTTGTYTNYGGTGLGTYDSNLQTYTGTSQTLYGLNVSAQLRYSNSIVAGRMIAAFQNTSGAAITRVVRLYNDLGSDSGTYLKYTNANQTISNITMPVVNSTTFWKISSDNSGVSGTENPSDPINSYVYGSSGAAVTPSVNLTNGIDYITYTITVPANSTQRLMFVFGLGEVTSPANTHAGALNGVKTYLDTFTKLPADLVGDISGADLATVQNWVISPSPSSFTSTQVSPTNTSNSFTYSMNMTQSITGLASSDFNNSGTATSCTFTPNNSSGSSFIITASGCGEGTVRPQLLANSVTGTQTGPSVNSPASTTVVIDRTSPTLSTLTTTNGNYNAALNANMNFTLRFSESVTVTGTPRLQLTIGSATEYANFISLTDSRTATFRFVVTVDYNNIDLDGISVSTPLQLNSGSISDLATNSISDLSFTPPVTTSVNVYQPPSAPTIDSITANNGSVSVFFTAGSSNGSTVSNYKYSLNSGSYIALSPTDAISPITITGLTNGTSYQIEIRAVSNLGDGLASNSLSSTPSASASITVSLTASATTATKGTTITITAQVNQAGVVTFFWNDKRINGCIKRVATTSATCSWKPSVTGQWSIQALLDPNDPTYINSYSQKLPVFILRRSGTR